jgi:hypothetical protein
LNKTGLRDDCSLQETNESGGDMQALVDKTVYAQPLTDGGKQLRLFLRKVCQPALIASFAPDSEYALIHKRLLELGKQLDVASPPKPTKFARDFDIKLDAVYLGTRLYVCIQILSDSATLAAVLYNAA